MLILWLHLETKMSWNTVDVSKSLSLSREFADLNSNIWAPEEQKKTIKVSFLYGNAPHVKLTRQDNHEPLWRVGTIARNDVHRARGTATDAKARRTGPQFPRCEYSSFETFATQKL